MLAYNAYLLAYSLGFLQCDGMPKDLLQNKEGQITGGQNYDIVERNSNVKATIHNKTYKPSEQFRLDTEIPSRRLYFFGVIDMQSKQQGVVNRILAAREIMRMTLNHYQALCKQAKRKYRLIDRTHIKQAYITAILDGRKTLLPLPESAERDFERLREAKNLRYTAIAHHRMLMRDARRILRMPLYRINWLIDGRIIIWNEGEKYTTVG